jgi:ribose transport system permease protein
MIADLAARLRSRYVPDHIVGEVLGRRWTDNAIPVLLLIALSIFMTESIPNFLSVGNLSDTSRQIGEFGLMVIGMTIVIACGRYRSQRWLHLRTRQFQRSRAD